jgi:hypothetical protein
MTINEIAAMFATFQTTALHWCSRYRLPHTQRRAKCRISVGRRALLHWLKRHPEVTFGLNELSSSRITW